MPPRGDAADLRFDAVQFRITEPARRADLSSRPVLRGFVEILAAEQTPDNANWYQGIADAVRQAVRHFAPLDASFYLILAGDHLYRMDFRDLVDTHIETGADITIAAQPVSPIEATQMGIFRFDWEGQIVGFEEKPSAERLAALGRSVPVGSTFAPASSDKPFVASMGIYVFSRDALLDILAGPGTDFGKEVIPSALATHRVHAYLHRGYWVDVGTVRSFYDANIMLTQRDALFSFFIRGFRSTRGRGSFPARGSSTAGPTRRSSATAVSWTHARSPRRSSAFERSCVRGRRSRAPCCSGRTSTRTWTTCGTRSMPLLGVGRGAVLDRVIVDKNARIGDGARLTNERGLTDADGEGYCIRDGIIVVPRGDDPDGTVI